MVEVPLVKLVGEKVTTVVVTTVWVGWWFGGEGRGVVGVKGNER